eukprot:GFUD01004076.1.p1 GENE.GFUD01004076.1~~GFUD01004076.1.p1  ORF type:complete len:290 (-),score=46.91 GFUD01004076.1:190-1059(-)
MFITGLSLLCEHLFRNVQVLVLLLVIDKAVVQLLLGSYCSHLSSNKIKNARWFILHAIGNLFVVLTSMTSICAAVVDPLSSSDTGNLINTSLFSSGSVWPLTIANSIHIYHIIGGFDLSYDDTFHHLVFVPIIGFPGQIFLPHIIGNCAAFFGCGLSGGIEYLVLSLRQLGKVDKLFQKRLCANLYLWIRMPGLLMSSFLLYQGWLCGNVSVPSPVVAVLAIGTMYNALFYCRQSLINFTVNWIICKMKTISKNKQISVKIGENEMDWESAIEQILPSSEFSVLYRANS